MIGKHFLVTSGQESVKVERQYTIANCMRKEFRKELSKLLD